MTFSEGFITYFTQVMDVVHILSILLFVVGFVILFWPNRINKRNVILLSIVTFCECVAVIFVPALVFALSNMINGSMELKAVLYSFAVPLIIVASALVFTKLPHGSNVRKTHIYLKTYILVATAIIVDVLAKNIGFFAGQTSPDFAFGVDMARLLPYFLFPLMCLLLHKVDIHRYRNLSKEMIIIITGLCSVLIATGIYEHIDSTLDTEVNILFSILDTLLLLILGYSYYATYKNVENRHKITNLEVQKTLEDAERMSIEIDRNNREELEKIRHDIKNQFSYLGVLIKQGKIDEAQKYVDDYLDSSNNKILYSFSCSNGVINSIINLELTKAKIRDIPIDVKVVVPPRLPFKDIDLVSLLTNAIDNALENYYSETKEPIKVRILKQNDFIRFMVSNPVNMKNINTNNLTTTRKAGRGHGYGTKIVRNIASIYGGYVDYDVENNTFVCDVLLNLNIEEIKNV